MIESVWKPSAKDQCTIQEVTQNKNILVGGSDIINEGIFMAHTKIIQMIKIVSQHKKRLKEYHVMQTLKTL